MLMRNVKSIQSISNIINNSSNDSNDNNRDIKIDIRLGGWAIDDSFWNRFEKVVNNCNYKNIKVERYDKNYGKSYCVNKLSSDIKDYDFMISVDSDIIFKDIPDMLQRLVSMSRKISNYTEKPFGMFALNQEGHNCHITAELNRSFNFGKEKVLWNDYPGHIAGGCIFTSSENWIKCNGYREMGVYAGDDAYFLLDTHKNKYTYGMIESISVIHPLDDNKEYAKWKVDFCKRDTNGVESGISDDQIKESTDFWTKQNDKK
jgi:hypothetical protein